MDDFDFFSDAFRTDPHGEYARMREQCPVAHASEPYDWWAATRAADVSQMLRKYKLWSSAARTRPRLRGRRARW